jgi:hypothetical protein
MASVSPETGTFPVLNALSKYVLIYNKVLYLNLVLQRAQMFSGCEILWIPIDLCSAMMNLRRKLSVVEILVLPKV